MKIGLIGVGVVGGAVLEAYKAKGIPVAAYDIAKPELGSLEAVLQTDVAFVCVPTPTLDGKGQDLSAIQDVIVKCKGYKGVLAIKSTILPGTTKACQKIDPSLRLVHQPEFLTEANAVNDFINQKTAFIGGQHYGPVMNAYKLLGIPVMTFDDPTTTEMIKYTNNLFLATVVSFLNELFDVCAEVGISYTEVMRGAILNGKIPESHSRVPGPDGNRGFGGMCFIKDTEAFVSKFKGLHTLEGAIKKNREVRPTAYDGSERVGVNWIKS